MTNLMTNSAASDGVGTTSSCRSGSSGQCISLPKSNQTSCRVITPAARNFTKSIASPPSTNFWGVSKVSHPPPTTWTKTSHGKQNLKWLYLKRVVSKWIKTCFQVKQNHKKIKNQSPKVFGVGLICLYKNQGKFWQSQIRLLSFQE